jgi:hypothetical protein
MSRTFRIVAVTAGLLTAGAVLGALAAVAALMIGLAMSGDGVGLSPTDVEALSFVAVIGAFFGGLLLPATAWIFLRRVPLGLALLGTLLGTILGGSLGWIVATEHVRVQAGLGGAFVGFASAALLLRLRASAPAVRRVVS